MSIFRYSGGIILNKEELSTNGFLTNSMGDKNGIPQSDLILAFQEAESAKSLPSNTKFEMGCVQTSEGISTYYEYKGKKFIGSTTMDRIFNGKLNLVEGFKKTATDTNYLPHIIISILFAYLLYQIFIN